MTPNAPVENFHLPRFGDQGYTEWVLRGAKGIYDGPEQVRVEEMGLRIYSGDERMVLELSLDSPSATIRLEENSAYSDESIEIVGSNFKISGVGWEWIGATKEIVVKSYTRVEFAQAISGGVQSDEVLGAEASRTTIESDQMVLQTTGEAYFFEFSGDVKAASMDWLLEGEFLEVSADVPEGRESSALQGGSEIDSVQRCDGARGGRLSSRWAHRCARRRRFFTANGAAVLQGQASIEVDRAYSLGTPSTSQGGQLVITSEDSGRRRR